MERANNREQPKKELQATKIRTGLCGFLLPIVLLGTVLAAMGIFPFGEKSLLIIDMSSEYVDYLAQLNESLHTGQSFVRSWNMGMGLNMLGLVAFYTASPFNLLVLLLPVEGITETLFVVTLLKIGLAGFAFVRYTDYALGRRGMFAVIFAVAYALNAYSVAYASNIMWLDGVAFLPLVMLGVEKILRENKCAVFLWSLLYVFFTSYYIGYMIGGFALLYFLAQYFSVQHPAKLFWAKFGRFVGTAALAAGCCAFMLLPAYLNLRSGQSSMWDVPVSFDLNKSFVRIASRLLPGVYDSLTDVGYPNIFCTMLGVLGCVLYFIHKGATRREKLLFGGLLAFLLLSFSCEILDLAWHAFEVPTWFPARYSFLFCFLLLCLAMRFASQRHTLSPTGMLGALLLLVVLLVEIGVSRFDYVAFSSVLAGGLLLALYALIWWQGQIKDGHSGALGVLVLVLVCTEVWANTYVMEREMDLQFGYETRESYTGYRAKYLPAVEAVSQRDTDIYRMEITEQRSANGSMALGYNGISHYSTTTNQPLNRLLRSLGYNKGTTNELRFAPTTPLTSGLLGIRYVLSPTELRGGYDSSDSVGNVHINRNQCAFPMAFAAQTGALAWRSVEEDPFLLQNSMVSALFGRELSAFEPIPDVEERVYNADLTQKDGYREYIPRVRDEASIVEFWIHNPTGKEAYAYFPVWGYKYSPARVFVNGEERERDLAYRGNTVLSLGTGEEIHLELELGSIPTRIKEAYFYNLDLDLARSLAAQATQDGMRFTKFTDTLVEGTVTLEEGQVLLTTMPYDEGFTITVDNRRVQPERFADVFLALRLPPGEHHIVMRYSPPGLWAGCVLSVASLMVLALLLWRRRKAHRTK